MRVIAHEEFAKPPCAVVVVVVVPAAAAGSCPCPSPSIIIVVVIVVGVIVAVGVVDCRDGAVERAHDVDVDVNHGHKVEHQVHQQERNCEEAE